MLPFPDVLPASRVPDPMETPALRWGILGPGWIAEQFIASVRKHTRQNIVAVGSRRAETATAFAQKWDIGTAYGSYEALLADDSLDVVYITTPHNFHYEHAMMALEAGKNVLVEKPMALDYRQAAEMVAKAREKGLFFAEALWTYFLPKFDVFQQVIDSGILGEIKSIHTEYGEYFTKDHRIFNAELAGGPLLDLGTYPVSLISKLMGVPKQVFGLKQNDKSGVHGQISVIMANEHGNQSTMSTTLYGHTPTNAAIVGAGGSISFESAFNLPGPFTVRSADGSKSLVYDGSVGRHFEGLFYEAAAVARAITAGDTEVRERPLRETLDTMATLDLIRGATNIEFG